jgi:hypothetical protein
MKKLIISVLILLVSAISCLGAPLFSPWEGGRHYIGGHILPLGIYSYVATQDSGDLNFFGGGFNEIGMSYEYRPWSLLGFEGYFDFKGYRFDGYRADPSPFVRIWGLPNIKAGAGGVLHLPLDREQLDFSFCYGLEYAHYIADEASSFPGLGMTARLRATWYASKLVGIGVTGAAHYSTHAGGPYSDDPDATRLPFQLAELSVGIQGYINL